MSEPNALIPAPAPEIAQAPPQFARGFEGMAVAPFPEDARRVLAEPVNPHDVEIKPDGIVFLPGVAYRRVLTRAFGAGGWSIAPRSAPRYMKDQNVVVWHCALFALGRYVSEAVGECYFRDNNPNMSYASAIEGARTDALGKCAKDTGYAAELWDTNWREKWKAEYATSYKQVDRRSGEEKTRWKLKNRVSNSHDLMVGAGGSSAAPAAPSTPTATAASSPPAASAAPVTSSASSRKGRSAPKGVTGATTDINGGAKESGSATAKNVGAPSASIPAETTGTDTGEPATEEQLAAIRASLKALQWKVGYIKLWWAQTFGLQIIDARRAPEALSRRQATACIYLLDAHGSCGYNAVLAEQRAAGNVP